MIIKAGDIVKRKCKVGHLDDSGCNSATWMFSTGYFIVLQTMSRTVMTGQGDKIKETVCRIMSDNGEINWISSRNLIKC